MQQHIAGGLKMTSLLIITGADPESFGGGAILN